MKITLRRREHLSEASVDDSVEHCGSVFPFHVKCKSIDVSSDELVFNVTGEHVFKKERGNLWIIGKRGCSASINQWDGMV